MTLQQMIEKRSSCRSFTNKPVVSALLAKIQAFSMKPLYPELAVHWEILSRDQVKCICPWTTRQLIAVYSQKGEGWLENVGFLFQQMDLYLQSLGLGACWLGMGKLNPKTAKPVENMEFVILLAFGYPKRDPLRRSGADFRRKAPEKIADFPDEKLEPARLAPSSVNSQPWYFTHAGEMIHAYCRGSGDMNRIDMGIALAQLYVANEEAFRFLRHSDPPFMENTVYIGSVTLN